MKKQTTRFSIVEHALADVVERLTELPKSPDAEKLRALAHDYEGQMNRWRAQPPGEEERAALLRGVLDLNVEVIRAGARIDSVPDDDGEEDEFPKAL